jgi:hypothetical protein
VDDDSDIFFFFENTMGEGGVDNVWCIGGVDLDGTGHGGSVEE